MLHYIVLRFFGDLGEITVHKKRDDGTDENTWQLSELPETTYSKVELDKDQNAEHDNVHGVDDHVPLPVMLTGQSSKMRGFQWHKQ